MPFGMRWLAKQLSEYILLFHSSIGFPRLIHARLIQDVV